MSCETEQGRFDFPTCWEGTSLPSWNFQVAIENSAALVSASIVFKLGGTDTAALTLSHGSGLTLTDTTAGAWVVTVDQINNITLAPGVYYYSLILTESGNFTHPPPIVGTWEIKNR